MPPFLPRPSACGCIIARWPSTRVPSRPLSGYQDSIVRPNLPDRTESPDLLGATAEGLVGNRMMTVRDRRPRIDL